MDLDEEPSTPPTNTAGVTLTQGLVRIQPTNVSVVISLSENPENSEAKKDKISLTCFFFCFRSRPP